MRFLVVYKDYADEARKLVKSLGVPDVEVVVLGNGRKVDENTPVRQLSAHRGAPTAAVSINRKLQRSLEDDFGCELQLRVESIKGAGKGLVDWLVPPKVNPGGEPYPKDALLAASAADQSIVIAHNALVYANDLADHRHAFVRKASDALRALAAAGCSAPGGLERFFIAHGLQFAVNGPISVSVQVLQNGRVVEQHDSEWHLKEGDATKRPAAARLYFSTTRFDGKGRVLVHYCGPHPESGLVSLVYL